MGRERRGRADGELWEIVGTTSGSVSLPETTSGLAARIEVTDPRRSQLIGAMQMISPPGNRLVELDGLRGLAALAVVFSHWFFLFGPITYPNGHRDIAKIYMLIELTPLHLFAAGHEAVMVFFLLSGFVLTLSMGRRLSVSSYGRYLLKRGMRLYIPYAAALLLACAANWRWHGSVSSLSDWFNHVWRQSPDKSSIVRHLALIGRFDYSRYNVAFWSLVYEARISIVFPFIVLLLRRWTARSTILVALALSVATQLAVLRFGHNNELITFHYLSLFMLGILAALRKDSIAIFIQSIRLRSRKLIVILALTLLSTNQLVKHVPGYLHRIQILTDWPGIVAAFTILVLAFTFQPVCRFLRHRIAIRLGQISYSLYLVHSTVLFSLVHAGWRRYPHWLIFTVYVPVAIAASFLFYICIEKPSIRLSRIVGQSVHMNGPLYLKRKRGRYENT